jgi:hypothetical protein
MPRSKYSKKQKALAAMAVPRNKITKADLLALRKKKKLKVKPTAKQKAIEHLKKKRKK